MRQEVAELLQQKLGENEPYGGGRGDTGRIYLLSPKRSMDVSK